MPREDGSASGPAHNLQPQAFSYPLATHIVALERNRTGKEACGAGRAQERRAEPVGRIVEGAGTLGSSDVAEGHRFPRKPQ